MSEVLDELEREGERIPSVIDLETYLIQALGIKMFEEILQDKESIYGYSIQDYIHWVELFTQFGMHQSLVRLEEEGRRPSNDLFIRKLKGILGNTVYQEIKQEKSIRFTKSEIDYMVKLFIQEKMPSKVYAILRAEGKRCPSRADYIGQIVKGVLGEQKYLLISQSGLAEFLNSQTKYDIKDMQEIARIIGILRSGRPGRFLSTEVKGMNNKYLWACGRCGNKFEARAGHVLYSKSWCPDCASVSEISEESFALSLVSHLFKKQVVQHYRPKWLINSEGNQMHLDGYFVLDLFGEKIKFAFEYDESQHFTRHPVYHQEDGDFEWGFQRDREKDILTELNGVILIRIPYSLHPDNINRFYKRGDEGMQSRIINVFLSKLKGKYLEQGLSTDIVNQRLSELRMILESRSEYTLKQYYLSLIGQTTLDSFL